MTSADLREELSCSICLNIYTDPLTLRCGHNFCRVCINQVLDSQEPCGLYTCPECREEFQKRPVLFRAWVLRNLAEKFLVSHPDQKETGIFCTYCIDSPVPAIKTCLLCESSLCDKHLRVHAKSPEHVLCDPTNIPGNRKCFIHQKIMEYYCTKERVSICVYCIAVGEHKGHQVESLDEASEKKKKKLKRDLEIMTAKKAWAENQVQSLQQRRRDVQKNTAAVTERITALFRDLTGKLEEFEKSVLNEIFKEEEKISSVIKQLEMQKDELSRRISNCEDLCETTDPMIILKDQNSDTEDIYLHELEQNMDTAIPNECDFHEDLITERLHKLSDIIKDMHSWIQQPAAILLDVETAANNIQISDDLKTAFWSSAKLNRPENPKRFHYYQVVSKRSFSAGRYYWEVDTSHSTSWRVGMCYPSMGRRSCIGENKDSWCLQRCNQDRYNKMHDGIRLPFLHKPTSNKFRIYMDYEAGQIAFFELSNPIKHIHTFNTTFTEPLHAAISVWKGSITITN